METHRILAAAVATVVLTPAVHAEVVMQLSADRTYTQTNAFNLRFDGGNLNVNMRDGNFLYDSICPLNGSPTPYPPSEIPPCQIGATGLVTSGDLDGDGVRDDFEHYSITTVQQAQVIEPSRPDLCQLVSGPPSLLPRPLANFEDETVVLFYNIRNAAQMRQYELSWYSLDRPYLAGSSELKRMSEEIIPGQYVFTFPRLDYPDLTPVAYAVTIAPMLDALTTTGRTKKGFRFTSGSWFEEDYQMDPRTINRITWTGNDRTIVRRGDQIYFSILDPQGGIAFPPTIPGNPVRLTNPTVQSYNMPPYFFVVGDEGVMNLQYNRLLPSSGVTFDTSGRNFQANVRFVDSFPGYVQSVFPAGVSKRDRSVKGDYDRDGVTNGDEFAYQDVTNEAINAAAKAAFVPFTLDLHVLPADDEYRPADYRPVGRGGLAVSESYHSLVTLLAEPITDKDEQTAGPGAPYLNTDLKVVMEVPIRPLTGNSVKYQFQEIKKGKKGKKEKPQKLKIEGNYTLETVVTPETETKTIRIEVLTILDTLGYWTVPTEVTYDVPKMVLTSINPVADEIAPLPKLTVQATPVALK